MLKSYPQADKYLKMGPLGGNWTPIGHDCGTLFMGLVALQEGTPESLFSLSTMWAHSEKAAITASKKAHIRTWPSCHHNLSLPACRTVRKSQSIVFCFYGSLKILIKLLRKKFRFCSVTAILFNFCMSIYQCTLWQFKIKSNQGGREIYNSFVGTPPVIS